MNLFFFGADKPWKVLIHEGFRRRNTIMLETFYKSNNFENIFVVFKTTRYNALKRILRSEKNNIKDIYLASFIPEIFFKNKIKKINNLLYIWQLRLQGVKVNNNDKQIVWCYQTKAFNSACSINIRGKYFLDTDHNIIDDVNIENSQKTQQQELLFAAGKKCMSVISSARSMIKWYSDNGYNNTFRLRNGINIGRFKNIKRIKKDKKVIGYLGTLSKWVDYELLELIIQNNQSLIFRIIGRNYKNSESNRLTKYPNVEFLGDKNPKEIPFLLSGFDIALNVYKKEHWLDVDSMKIYEYMASGIPVITSNFHPYLSHDFDNLLYIGENYLQIQNHINHLIDFPLPFDYAYEFLIKNTWDVRVQSFINKFLND